MFTQPVSMLCTQEQYEADLRRPLLEMGYKEFSMYSFNKYPCLANNYLGDLGNLSNITGINKDKNNRYYIDNYNPQLFLALAAMTDEKYGIKGEWWKCNQSYVDIFTGADAFTGGTLYKSQEGLDNPMAVFNNYDNPDGFYPENLDYFRKATKEELIDKFTIKQEPEMKTTYSATVSQIMEIEAIACNTWKLKIRRMIKNYLNETTGMVVLQESIVEKMFEAATSEQKPVLQSIFPLYGKQEDKNAFIKEFRQYDIENTSKQLFNDGYALQILSSATPDDKPELNGRAFYVNSDYKVEIGKASPGTYISIYKK